ncbi:MAG: excinuclease ABC subunit UvrC [Verrucomicrobiales bacterium]|jgi:excinuclease ABC subunit C|nr:excinuclease ABC subunit UvrC [Verrucomicrobiales bacterium]
MPAERPDLTPKLRALPHRPGVYIYRDRLGRIIYVGKAKDLRRRVSQYFHPSRKMTADPKTRALIAGIWDLETLTVASDAEAIVLEGRLIKEHRPKYNISFRDDKRFLMVSVNLNDPYPRFQFARFKKDDGARYFGPFAHAGAVRNTLNLMKKKFGLRSCMPVRPTKKDFKHCLDHIIKNCSAPCVAKISRSAYGDYVRQACEFLEGKSAGMTRALEEEMKRHAAALDFEKAATLRNLLDDIRATTKPQRRFTRALPSTVRPAHDLEELRVALTLTATPALIECFDISNISVTHQVAAMVCFRDGRPARSHYRRYRVKTVTGQNDFASMAEVVGRRYARMLREGGTLPDLIVVDGGKGQLSAALAALRKLGLHQQRIVGLAKRNEEIFRPDEPLPLVLPRESGALRLMQRIRDEAHRIANGYHQLLMKQRVSESVLDDCPGLGRIKKLALLKHFGSVEKIKAAAVANLRVVDGIGPKLAENIVGFFHRPLTVTAVDGDQPVSAGGKIYRLRGPVSPAAAG